MKTFDVKNSTGMNDGNKKPGFLLTNNNGRVAKDARYEKLQSGFDSTKALVDIKKTLMARLLLTAILTAAITMVFNNLAYSQSGRLYLQGEEQRNRAIKMVTGQYGDAEVVPVKNGQNTRTKTNATRPVARSTGGDVSSVDQVFGGEKYLKTKEEGRRYEEFEVYDVKGMSMNKMVMGLMTNTLDRDIRYNDRGQLDKKVTVANEYITKVDEKGEILTNVDKAYVTTVRFNNKVFVIMGENDYRYIDGKKLEGSKKLVDELGKGKPITETTFFYELQKAGIIDNKISLEQFAKMSMNQKQNLLNGIPMAVNF